MHGLPSCGVGCFVECCGNLACEAEGGTRIRDFHHRCLRTSLGISRALQISQHISNEEVRCRAGLTVSLADMISCRKLRWLGHIARMNDNHLPKQLLFGWLPHRHPPHGVKLR